MKHQRSAIDPVTTNRWLCAAPTQEEGQSSIPANSRPTIEPFFVLFGARLPRPTKHPFGVVRRPEELRFEFLPPAALVPDPSNYETGLTPVNSTFEEPLGFRVKTSFFAAKSWRNPRSGDRTRIGLNVDIEVE